MCVLSYIFFSSGSKTYQKRKEEKRGNKEEAERNLANRWE